METGHLPTVEIMDILNAKDERSFRLKASAKKNTVLVSISMNIPGNLKQFPLSAWAFDEVHTALRAALYNCQTEELFYEHLITGSEALLRINSADHQIDAATVKMLTIRFEAAHPLGRLVDIDVFDSTAVLAGKMQALSRRDIGSSPRQCLLCKEDAKICGRSRRHRYEELQEEISRRISDYYMNTTADRISDLAARALLYEVAVTPKPGLVDRTNNGSHTDMNFFTFIDSATALRPWFRKFFLAGYNGTSLSSEALFHRLQELGLQAEAAMHRNTAGVNTHKGAVFAFAILIASIGCLLSKRVDTSQALRITPEELRKECSNLGAIALADLDHANVSTAGLRFYHEYGITGARGSAAKGYPELFELGYPMLIEVLEAGMDLNTAGLKVFCHLLAAITDTNMIKRGGNLRALAARMEALSLLPSLSAENSSSILSEMDQQFIADNLSPGGSADLLAGSFFLYLLHKDSFLT